ncbi:tetratricopeptide repeat-containing diguanylate cyclase [Thalassotalea agarivorans]|uniref:diguanylate cyclase n=1 Tax=Thalassotalea agarivorans TaxID=349064 RepID=A0A1I0ENX1_THASX|nr:tetratricopeptide repeat-containing diguanylate cyclase [Thalassotalea agarivorans]SET47135.1 diguanylate cyclase (GGDEF) domain-containing protein [Thalassotalea agarivorans]
MRFIRNILVSCCLTLATVVGAIEAPEAIAPMLVELEAKQTIAEKHSYWLSIESQLARDDLHSRGVYYRQLGALLEEKNDIKAAFNAYDRAVDILSAIAPTADLVKSHQDRSYMIYLQSKDVSEYCPDRVKALALARELNDSLVLMETLIFNSFCYEKPEQLQDALALLEEATQLAEQYDDDFASRAMVYNATGHVYSQSNIFYKAIDYYEKAFAAFEQINDETDAFNMAHSISMIATELARWDVADKYNQYMYDKAKTTAKTSHDYLFFAHYNSGRTAYFKNEYDQAIALLTKALAERHTTEEVYFVKVLHVTLAKAYARSKNYEKAYMHAVLYLGGKDSITVNNSNDVDALAIKAYGEKDYQQVIEHLIHRIEMERKQKLDFIRNEAIHKALDHDVTMATYQNQAMAAELALKEARLQKSAQETKADILLLSLLVIVVIGLIAVVINVRKSRDVFQKQAQKDALTNIFNRGYILSESETLFTQAKKDNAPLSVILFDVDHFKSINDSYGHQTGDLVLKAVTDLCQTFLRKTELFGRYGGEEFLVVLPDTHLAVAQTVAERLRQNIESMTVSADNALIEVTVSLGVGCIKPGYENFDQLLHATDKALYKAKEGGRNQVQRD